MLAVHVMTSHDFCIASKAQQQYDLVAVLRQAIHYAPLIVKEYYAATYALKWSWFAASVLATAKA